VVVLALSAALSANRALAQTGKLCFAEVPDCIEGRFAEYWQQNGGLPVFGFPISPASEQETSGGRFLTQLFERNRFELHPENARPYDVLLGRLGDDRLRQLGRPWESQPKAPVTSKPGCVYFEQTQHLVCDQFLAYWRSHGLNLDGRQGFTEAESLALFGLPLTEASVETDSQGNSYLTQWYERARFELHPEIGPDAVLLGLLGREISTSEPSAQPAPAPTANCDGIPPSTNAEATPNCFHAGDIFEVTARDLKAGERVVFYVTGPDAKVNDFPVIYGDPSPDSAGVYHARGALSLANQPGIYALTFEGTKSGKKAIVFFKITAADPGAPPPVDHSLLPPAENVTVSVPSGRRVETIFTYRTTGFPKGTVVNIYGMQSDGKVVVAPFQRKADSSGNAASEVEFHTELTDPVGVYSTTFESVDKQYRAIGYFRVMP
jgi:hypothetical protein